MAEAIRLRTPPSSWAADEWEPQSLRTARCWREARRRREALAAGHELVPSDSARRCLQCATPIHRLGGPAFCGGDCQRAYRTVHPPPEVRRGS